MPWFKVRHIDNVDVLGTNLKTGHVLNSGDVVSIRWPDKTESEHKVRVVVDEIDAGIIGCYDTSYSYITLNYHGRKFEIPLEGLTALMMKRKVKPAPKVVPKWPNYDPLSG
jgi:hypothetical protein